MRDVIWRLGGREGTPAKLPANDWWWLLGIALVGLGVAVGLVVGSVVADAVTMAPAEPTLQPIYPMLRR